MNVRNFVLENVKLTEGGFWGDLWLKAMPPALYTICPVTLTGSDEFWSLLFGQFTCQRPACCKTRVSRGVPLSLPSKSIGLDLLLQHISVVLRQKGLSYQTSLFRRRCNFRRLRGNVVLNQELHYVTQWKVLCFLFDIATDVFITRILLCTCLILTNVLLNPLFHNTTHIFMQRKYFYLYKMPIIRKYFSPICKI